MAPLIQAAGALLLAAGTGAATMSVMRAEIPDMPIPEAEWVADGALDGLTFYTEDRILETGEELRDVLHFRDGRFQSEKCQAYCDFGWTEYRTWHEGGLIHFATTTRCPDAPHTVVWQGTVDGDNVTFQASWTTRRWYWSHQVNGVGQGGTEPHEASDISG